jgi:uncharacterized protein (DUF1697 family)
MKYVAFLRGINVGGNNKVDMKHLKACFEALGFENVLTYINSGNVIFETKEKDEGKIIKKIETAIEKTFGFPVRVVVRDSKNISKVLKSIPVNWNNDADQKTDVLFLWDEYCDKKSLELITINPKVDTLKYIDGAIVWHLEKKDYSQSGMNKFIGTEVYKNMTARNVNTLRKLSELMKS